MFLEQICPGQVNSHTQAIHTFVYRNERFIVISKRPIWGGDISIY